jgi:hypothetical protein
MDWTIMGAKLNLQVHLPKKKKPSPLENRVLPAYAYLLELSLRELSYPSVTAHSIRGQQPQPDQSTK